jgi:hypothetical protein
MGLFMKVAICHIFPNATLALAGLIKCKCCNGTVVQVSIKDGGRYGCKNAKKEGCKNKLRISKKDIEAIILNDLKEKFLTAHNLKYVDKLALKDLCRKIELEPVPGKSPSANEQHIQSCSYYVANTSIQTIALLHEEYNSEVWVRKNG